MPNADRADVTVEFSPGEDPVALVLGEAIADVDGADPCDVPPLQRTLPAGHLDELLDSGTAVQFTFIHEGYRATVHSDGQIAVQSAD